MPATPTTSRSLLPPRTREVRFDEQWSFVAGKETDRDPLDPADDRRGDTRAHVAIDAEGRLVVRVVPGARTAEGVVAVVEDVERRAGGRPMDLITTDGYPAHEGAILEAYGERSRPLNSREARPLPNHHDSRWHARPTDPSFF